MVAESFKKKLNDWPTLKNASGLELRKFVDFLKSCNTAMSTLGHLGSLDSIEENKRILHKLPMYIVNKWNREVDRRIYRQGTSPLSFPSFADFVEFMKPEVPLGNSVLLSRGEETKDDRSCRPNSNIGARSFASGSREVNGDSIVHKNQSCNLIPPVTAGDKCVPCAVCKNQHKLEHCASFEKMTNTDKQAIMRTHALCFGCFTCGHVKNRCRNKMTCAKCGRQHPTLLHDDNYKPMNMTIIDKPNDCQDKNIRTITSHCLSSDNNDNACMSDYLHSLIVPVEVYHVDNPNDTVFVYALIDEQSDACFVTDGVLHKLNTSGASVELKLSTVLAEDVISCKKASGLVVRGINETTKISLPGCYSRNSIPAKESQI